MITIDGSRGEGGGQVLRTSLGLSLATGTPFRIDGIRAGRARPGLLRQHLTGVRAATEIGAAEVEGDELGSTALVFRPRAVRPGRYHFAIGTAGSATLVLQTVLPALMLADGPSELLLEGGTHNPAAPPFDFLERAFLPLLARMGPKVTAVCERPGFYPAGGGKIVVQIEPCAKLDALHLETRGEIVARLIHVTVANLGGTIMNREIQTALAALARHDRDAGNDASEVAAPEVLRRKLKDQPGPGNVMHVELESEHVTELFTGFGRKGVTAERVAEETTREAINYLAAGVPVGPHLADQLLLPMALAGGGSFRTTEPTGHTRTQCEILSEFLPVQVDLTPETKLTWRAEVRPRSGSTRSTDGLSPIPPCAGVTR